MFKTYKLTKEQREMLRCEYAKVWPGDESMIDYCTKKDEGVFIANDGLICTFEKPSIETRFCFGERGYDYDEVQKTCHALSKNERYFFAENIRRTAAYRMISVLYGFGWWSYSRKHIPYVVKNKYGRQTDDCKLASLIFCQTDQEAQEYAESHKCELRKLEDDEKQRLIRELQNQIHLFAKRVRSYLKRYGMSKCHFWTYWIDR